MTELLADFAAEDALCGAALSNEAAATAFCELVDPMDLYQGPQRQVAEAIRLLHGQGGGHVDAVVVSAYLGDKVDKALVHSLPDLCPAATNVATYAGIVSTMARRRRLLALSHRLTDLATANGKPSDGLLAEAERLTDEALGAERARDGASGSELQRRFDDLVLTGPQFASRTPELIDFIAPPYVARAHLHEIVGKLKHGKTRFYSDLAYSVLNGIPFLNQPTQQSAVMFLMEDSDGTMRLNLERAGILEHPDLHLMNISWLFRSGLVWQEVCRCVGDYVARHGINLLFTDTFLRWAGLTEGQESDSGACAQALAPLDAIRQETGAAIVVVHHEGKKHGGDTSDAGRGSSAIGAFMDSILVLRRVSGQGPKAARRRKLEYIGRFDAPANVVVELDGGSGHYRLIGDALTTETEQARQFALDALPEHETRAVTERWLCDESGIDSSTMGRALKALMRDGFVTGRLGAGGASSKAFGYWLQADQQALGES